MHRGGSTLAGRVLRGVVGALSVHRFDPSVETVERTLRCVDHRCPRWQEIAGFRCATPAAHVLLMRKHDLSSARHNVNAAAAQLRGYV